jgi:hypothetical protein
MTENIVRRLMSAHRRTLLVAAALMAPIATLGFASSALAVEHHPKGDYASFSDCPLSNTATTYCVFATTEKGKFIVGKKNVPILNAITLQGGTHEVEGSKPPLLEFIGAEDGNTLSKTPQNVPGGLLGLINCEEIKGEGFFEKLERGACKAIFENKLTGVTATTELAAPASSIGLSIQNLIESKETALSLPVKVKLENPLLGSNCYVGSNAHPIVINFTTGTTNPPKPNTPITGSVGKVEFLHNGELVILRENALVNNSFGAPKTTGCGGFFEFLIGPIIDGQLGVPAAEGTNTAILEGTLKIANATAVKASE